MQTFLDCLPCFMRQALAAARRVDPDDEAMHRRVLAAWAAAVPDLDLTLSPPAQAGHIYGLLARATGAPDPFAADKDQANRRVLELLPGLRARRDASPAPLRTALEMAIIGNYLDAGIGREFDWEGELAALEDALDPAACAEFEAQAGPGRAVLVLGDNAGEIAMDILLVEALQARGCRVTYAVRGRPILNDATLEDARFVGMTEACPVVSSGVDTPGTVPERCDPAFLDRMKQADLILSKGQGNFEALSDRWPGVFFAFKVKCPVAARLTGRPEGSSVFRRLD
ncbi:MAG: DUF89 domain-containing protein [Desulfovibrionaceae bacterium]